MTVFIAEVKDDSGREFRVSRYGERVLVSIYTPSSEIKAPKTVYTEVLTLNLDKDTARAFGKNLMLVSKDEKS